jgi:DmsE family decaheme c-type cytochrome
MVRLACLVGAIFSLLCLIGMPRFGWADAPTPAPSASAATPSQSPEAGPTAEQSPEASPDAEKSAQPSPSPETSPEASPSSEKSPESTPSPEKAAPKKKTYVGREACLECHDEYKDTFHRTIHAKDPSTAPDAANQCEGCHGPGSIHVDDNEAASIISPKRLPPADVNAICQRCHESMRGQYEWRFSRHATSNVSCTECHEVHPKKKADLQPRLLRKTDEKDVCYSCHADVRGQTLMPSHHPIEEGRLKCSDCHNVHGSELSAFKDAPTSRELCLRCHQQYRGPFVQEHQPVSDDCATCHKPHGSMEENLLTMSEPFLCQRCHVTVHNPHVPPVLTPAAQLGNQALMFSRCTVCHFNVHGSEQSPTFTR